MPRRLLPSLLACLALVACTLAAPTAAPWWLPLPGRASASAAAAGGAAAVSTACSSGLPDLLKSLGGGGSGAFSSVSAVSDLGQALTATCGKLGPFF